jgi:protein gp37
MNNLTTTENSKLKQCETIIERGQKTFYEVGMALKTIRDARLYRSTHRTFEDYCRERWGFEKTTANRFITSSIVVENLTPIGVKPETESQLRPLTALKSPDEQREAWTLAVDTAPDGKVTAAHVETVVKQYREEKKQEETIKPVIISKFNRTNDNIEWAAWTWNPVTGCKHDCEYCYARDIACRFNGNFNPQFHKDRINAPENTTPDHSIPGGKNVFVCSMADLFGTWVPNDWIFSVMNKVKENPQWNFIFLTKNPRRYVSIQFPDNAWVGATVDRQSRVEQTENEMSRVNAKVKFLSCEPMLEYLTFRNLRMFDWVIIGARSKTTTGGEFQPQFDWVLDITNSALDAGCKVYWKPNLTVRPRQYPEV